MLALNLGSCPLTSLAARSSGERADNFDIYLSPCVARHNTGIFGALFVVFELISLVLARSCVLIEGRNLRGIRRDNLEQTRNPKSQQKRDKSQCPHFPNPPFSGS
jgi:hypothetical protein